MNDNHIRECLEKQLAILEKIRENTETQSRFIKKREIRGLGRMLRERAALIDQFATIDRRLQEALGRNVTTDLGELVQFVIKKRDEIINYGNQVLQEAEAERDRIKVELRSIRMKKTLKNQYEIKWKVLSFGNRFNEKG